MNESLQAKNQAIEISSPHTRGRRLLSKVGRIVTSLDECMASSKYYAAAQEDIDRPAGTPSLADRRGRDVLVIRSGVRSLSPEEIHGAGNAIRAIKQRTQSQIRE